MFVKNHNDTISLGPYIYSVCGRSKGSGEEFSNILSLKLRPHVHFFYLKTYNLFSVYLLNFQISYLDIG